MTSYHVFGGRIRSELALPDLRRARGVEADWQLFCRPAPAPERPGTRLGTDRVYADLTVRLDRNEAGYRLTYDDTGVFDVGADGRMLEWYRPPEADLACAVADVLGRVFCTALHAAGLLCVHASAVALREGAVAFMGPRSHGKSTIASALTLRGARLLTDDALPVVPGMVPKAKPGVQGVRLWEDAAGRVDAGFARRSIAAGGKTLLTHLPRARLMMKSQPLAAIYLLSPQPVRTDGPAAERELLPAFRGAAAIVGHTKIGDLLGGEEAVTLMRRALATANAVPVYRLDYVRDFARQDEALDTILGWHPLAPARSSNGRPDARSP